MISTHPSIVVIDDSIRDLELFTFACEAGEIPVQITPFTDGKAALRTLMSLAEGTWSLPSIIIVDLNMPGITGLQVIEAIKTHPVLCQIPVYVMTTSDNPRDRKRCQDLGVHRYLVKPSTFSSLVQLLKDVLGSPPDSTPTPCR